MTTPNGSGGPPVWVPRRMTPSDGENIAGCGALLIVSFVIVFSVLLVVINVWSIARDFVGWVL